MLPIQTCWPDDVGPLVTWPLVITRGPHKERQNLGIYRMQLIGRNRLIMRWLSHRGGALDFQEFRQQNPGKPLSGGGGAGRRSRHHPGAVTPMPDTLSEYAFAGLLRGSEDRAAGATRAWRDLQVPAQRRDRARRLHRPRRTTPTRVPSATTPATTTRSNAFRCSRSSAQLHRDNPIYHSTYTGRPPDEPAVLGVALNEVFVPLLQKPVPRDRRLLPAARGLLVPPGGGHDEASSIRAMPSA